jgi:phage terminase large subunit
MQQSEEFLPYDFGMEVGDIFHWCYSPELHYSKDLRREKFLRWSKNRRVVGNNVSDNNVEQEEDQPPPISIIIQQGGLASGKTYAILQVLIMHCINKPGIYCQVYGRYLTSLKRDAIRVTEDIFKSSRRLRKLLKKQNKTESYFEFKNGSKIKFSDLEDESKATGVKSDYCYFSEANHITKAAFDAGQARCKGITYLDYNPNAQFWAHDLIDLPHVAYFRSNYLYNPFLWERDTRGAFVLDRFGERKPHPEIAIVRNILNRQNDKAWFSVYGLGYTGKTEGLVFKKTRKVAAFPEEYDKLQDKSVGIDFGWAGRTAIVLVAHYKNEIFVEELAYSSHLSESDIIDVLKKAVADGKIDKNTPIYGDPGGGGQAVMEGQMMKAAGFWNAKCAEKPAGSVERGIDWLNRLECINILSTSLNVWAEIMSYAYAENEKNPNEVIKKNDHAMDALRYAIYWKIVEVKNEFVFISRNY